MDGLPWPVWPKVDHLPIRRTSYGYEQCVHYEHPDLMHEHVQELDTPFAQVLQSSAQLHSVSALVLGDQNAGKTTFLHALCFSQDRNFTTFMGELPVLSATFLNSRFLPADSQVAPMDEPPFLDTDLARTTLLVNTEDYRIFMEEHGMECTSTAPLTVIQLVEVGGDHLDRLATGEDDADGVCRHSRLLLRALPAAAYVLNAREDTPAEAVQRRLSFLRALSPQLQLTLFASRGTVAGSLPWVVLDERGDVNVHGVLSVLAALCGMDCPVPPALGEELLRALALPREELYLDARGLYDALQDHDSARFLTCLPPSALVAHFEAACSHLVACHLVHRSAMGVASDFLTIHIGSMEWRSQVQGAPRVRPVAFPPLAAALGHMLVERGVPWAASGTASTSNISDDVMRALESRIVEEWTQGHALAWLLAVEDWALAGDARANQFVRTLQFPIALPRNSHSRVLLELGQLLRPFAVGGSVLNDEDARLWRVISFE